MSENSFSKLIFYLDKEGTKANLAGLEGLINDAISGVKPISLKFVPDKASLDAFKSEIDKITADIKIKTTNSGSSSRGGSSGSTPRSPKVKDLAAGTDAYSAALRKLNAQITLVNNATTKYAFANKSQIKEVGNAGNVLKAQSEALKGLKDRLESGRETNISFAADFNKIRDNVSNATTVLQKFKGASNLSKKDKNPLIDRGDIDVYSDSMKKLQDTLFNLRSKASLWSDAAKNDKTRSAYEDIQKQITALEKLSTKLQASSVRANEFKDAIKSANSTLSKSRNIIKDNGMDKSTKVLVEGTKEYEDELKKVNTLLNSVSAARRDWTAAKNGKSNGAYQDIEQTEEDLVKLKNALNGMNPGDVEKKISTLSNKFADASINIKNAGENTLSFGDQLRKLSKSFGGLFSTQRVFTYLTRTIREMWSSAVELDGAMVQLKIVTGATNDEMEKFGNTAASIAQRVGKSISDVAGSIEVFSRLGYNLQDSASLAEYATVLSNVASVESDEATRGLTSIIKGYNMSVSDAEHVSDVLIEVGQKYAVSAGELMEAFEKSSAALNATGTEFEKAAGLIAAANSAVNMCRAA